MKKIVSLLLAAVIFFSIANIAFADGAASSAKPQYKLTDVSYNGKDVTGKVVHQDGTPVAEKVKVRVTFYIVGNYYMATSYTMQENGSFKITGVAPFKITGVGPIIYITVIANAVSESGNIKLDAAEIVVAQD